MLDRYIIGNVTRISPEAPIPVVMVQKEEYRLGGAGNVSMNLQKLGCANALFGAIGMDENGERLKNIVASNGIQDCLFQDQPPTICKTRVIGNRQQIVRFDHELPHATYDASLLAFENIQASMTPTHIIVSDYQKGICQPSLCKKLMAYAQAHDAPVIVDPKGNDWTKYEGAYLVTPNVKELCVVMNEQVPNEDDAIVSTAQYILAKYQFEYLLVTRSEKGMTLVNRNEVTHFPSVVQEVYDVTGAGDTVVATLTASLAEGYPVKEACRRANIAAGYVVTKFGTYAISKIELESREL